MIERKIRLSDTEEVKDFVRAAGKCDFDIDVFYSRAVIDAKSLLGMLYLGLSKDLTVKYGQTDANFENAIRKYAVC
ncbi:MAG: HPr family phosphocarrier protein [Roseburia sp.]